MFYILSFFAIRQFQLEHHCTLTRMAEIYVYYVGFQVFVLDGYIFFSKWFLYHQSWINVFLTPIITLPTYGMQKTKKKFCLFAEGNDQGPRQRRVLCRGPSHCPRQRFFFKKIKFLQHFFAEGHGWRPSAKTFLKKIKISLPRACGEALGKDFF